MAVLDDLSGFEFEDLMEDVFRNLGYENVRQAERMTLHEKAMENKPLVTGSLLATVMLLVALLAIGGVI
jgi:hypothetical protein